MTILPQLESTANKAFMILKSQTALFAFLLLTAIWELTGLTLFFREFILPRLQFLKEIDASKMTTNPKSIKAIDVFLNVTFVATSLIVPLLLATFMVAFILIAKQRLQKTWAIHSVVAVVALLIFVGYLFHSPAIAFNKDFTLYLFASFLITASTTMASVMFSNNLVAMFKDRNTIIAKQYAEQQRLQEETFVLQHKDYEIYLDSEKQKLLRKQARLNKRLAKK